METNEKILIFVDDHTINHHVVARSDIMDADWDTHFDSRPDGVFIQHLTASGHISDGLAEAISPGPLVSLSTIALPGVNSVIVPLPSVVVVVVVISDTCAHANGATTANAMLKSIFFMISLSCLSCHGNKVPCVPVLISAGQELAAILDSDARLRLRMF